MVSNVRYTVSYMKGGVEYEVLPGISTTPTTAQISQAFDASPIANVAVYTGNALRPRISYLNNFLREDIPDFYNYFSTAAKESWKAAQIDSCEIPLYT